VDFPVKNKVSLEFDDTAESPNLVYTIKSWLVGPGGLGPKIIPPKIDVLAQGVLESEG
jgi:hypothetical protein